MPSPEQCWPLLSHDTRYQIRSTGLQQSPYQIKKLDEDYFQGGQKFVIGGFTDPRGTRVGLGALLVGYYEEGEFVYAAKVGTGFDGKLLT